MQICPLNTYHRLFEGRSFLPNLKEFAIEGCMKLDFVLLFLYKVVYYDCDYDQGASVNQA